MHYSRALRTASAGVATDSRPATGQLSSVTTGRPMRLAIAISLSSPSAADGDHRLRGGDDQGVARLAHAGWQSDGQKLVGTGAMSIRQQADDGTAGRGGALARRCADAPEPAVDDHGTCLREQRAHLFRRRQLRLGGF